MSEAGDLWERGEFSWGPDKRADNTSVLVSGLAVVIVILFIAGLAGTISHLSTVSGSATSGTVPPDNFGVPAGPDQSTTTSTTVPPAPGTQRLVDSVNGVRMDVPAGWQAVSTSSSGLGSQLRALAARHPADKPLLDLAIQTLNSVQVGAVAVDTGGRTVLLSYGIAAPGIQGLSQLPPSRLIDPLKQEGATNISSMSVQLPIGPGEQISIVLPYEGTAIGEVLDYFARPDRVGFILVATQGGGTPGDVLGQIASTVEGF